MAAGLGSLAVFLLVRGCWVDAQDWRDRFEERAAMREYCGGERREVAEREARKEIRKDWERYHGTR